MTSVIPDSAAQPATRTGPRAARPGLRLAVLAGLVVAAIAAYLFIDLEGAVAYILERRLTTIGAMTVSAVAIGLSTVVFHSITTNRILTPSIMGFDALYMLLQTLSVFALGMIGAGAIGEIPRFGLEVVAMLAFSFVLYGTLLSGDRPIHVVLLGGVVCGVLFRSLSTFFQRVMDPSEITILIDAGFASFTAVSESTLALGAVLVALGALVIVRRHRELDVMMLGRDVAVNLGVPHRRINIEMLAVVALLVSVATSLAGPSTFFGLLVAHLAYRTIGSTRHAFTLPAAALYGMLSLIGGQLALEKLLGFSTALSVIIDFLGGLVFLALLLGGRRTA